MKKFILFTAVLAVVLSGCSKFETVETNDTSTSGTKEIVLSTDQGTKITTMTDLTISQSFDWRTTKTLNVEISLPANGDLRLTRIYSPDGEKLFYKGYPEDGSRTLSTLVTVPTYINSVLVKYGEGIDIPITEVAVSETYMALNLASLKGGGGGDSHECDNCDKEVTALTLKYNGNISNPTFTVQKDHHNTFFPVTVNPDGTFSFVGDGADQKMGPKIRIHINGSNDYVEIHTSCSQDIYIGLEVGDFEVIDGASFNGGDFLDCGDEEDYNFVGTFAVEDLWPSKGDYDINDLVIEYDFEVTKDNQDNVEHITATFKIKAFGAGYQNGFGFEFPGVSPSDIASVSGYDIANGSIFNIANNGVENGQSTAVFIAYDNSFRVMTHPGSGIGVNTDKSGSYVAPVTITLEIEFVDEAVTFTELNIGEFNPFIVVNQNRDVEVHLPNYEPTDLVSLSYFGTIDDDSNGNDKYYKTEDNLFWAINIPELFEYPVEKQIILGAYNHFAAWAQSDGQDYPDWYKDLSGYRNASVIY